MTSRSLAVITAFAALVFAAPAGAVPFVEAHRGGPLVNGAPLYAENSLAAFAHSAEQGFILEFDVKLTADDVPIVIHDDTFDRTTTCSGLIRSKTFAEVASSCRIDWLGRPGDPGLPSAFIANPADRPAIPTLTQVMNLASAYNVGVSPEIKNIPPTTQAQLLENDFDPTFMYANLISKALRDSGYPHRQMIVQSFWPPNLTMAHRLMPRAQISLLTPKALNDGASLFAASQGWRWVSPEFDTGLNPQIVPLAHALKRLVVTWTLNTPALVRAAAAQGVDGIISDDPEMARAALGG